MSLANGSVADSGVTGRQTNGGKTIYDIAASLELPEGTINTKLATFDGVVAKQAKKLEGGRATFKYTVKQNAQYTNYYLEAIAPEGELDDSLDDIPIVQPGQSAGKKPWGGGGGKTAAERASIARMHAMTCAHTFIASLYSGMGPDFLVVAKKEASKLANEIFQVTKEKQSDNQAAQVDVAKVDPPPEPEKKPTTPAEVAADIPGVQVGVTEQEPASDDAVWS